MDSNDTPTTETETRRWALESDWGATRVDKTPPPPSLEQTYEQFCSIVPEAHGDLPECPKPREPLVIDGFELINKIGPGGRRPRPGLLRSAERGWCPGRPASLPR